VTKKAIDKDFDDPEVQRGGPSIESLWSPEARALYGPPRDTHHDVAVWFNEHEISPVLDVGCGGGGFARSYTGRWVGLDRSIEQLRKADGSRVLGEALTLPFADESFAGVSALYLLYFFEHPEQVAIECKRVLRPGGWFATCAPSAFDAPELDHVTPKGERGSFAAEDIPALLFEHFREVQMTIWDFPGFDLNDRETVRDYLYSWYYPQLTLEEAAERSQRVDVPLKLTKRGAWGAGRKPR
jgi:SAM-dependent methyltransferase